MIDTMHPAPRSGFEFVVPHVIGRRIPGVRPTSAPTLIVSVVTTEMSARVPPDRA